MAGRLALALALATLLGSPARAATDPWGGSTAITTTATGRFRTERIDGVWWLVTPDGHGFFSAGVDHLRPDGDLSPPLGRAPYHDNVLALYGSDEGWAAATLPRLHDFGLNTIGAFSRPELFPNAIAYTVTLTLAANAPAVPGVPPAIVARVTRDYFDPAFATGVAAQVATAGPACAADPWCLGVFTDNEMALGQSLAQPLPYLDAYLLLPSGAPGKVALQAFLADRYAGDVAAFNTTWGLALASFADLQAVTAMSPAVAQPPAPPNDTPAQRADRRAFDAFVARRFHQVTFDALRAASPGVLVLGSRLLILSTRPEVLAAIAPFVDVLTVNYYEIAPSVLAVAPTYPADYGIPFAHLFDDLDAMYRIAGKPILIGEFSYRAADSGLPNTLPPFFPTLATQAERAQATGTYFRRVLARPYLVGAHWFQYMDQPATGRFDGENQNFGLVKITDEAWPELTDRFRTVLGDVAARRKLVPGGGAAADCVVEWASTAPAATARKKRLPVPHFACRDNDPACDLDSAAGACVLEVQPCAAVDDPRVRRCTAAAPTDVRVVAPSARKDAATRDALGASLATLAPAVAAAGTCGPAVALTLPVGKTRALRTIASAGAARDRDLLKLRCDRTP